MAIGQSGQLEGKTYFVLGHAGLKTADGYYWHEYYVGTRDGDTAILVYEEQAWKLFTLFTPVEPLTLADRVNARADDEFRLQQKFWRVTYAGTSIVGYVMGQAPEGVREGMRASFFNASADGRQLVVSWTGEETEYYEGGPLGMNAVEKAFGLPERSLFWNAQISSAATVAIVVGLLIVLTVVGANLSRESYTPEPPARQAAPATRLPNRLVGHLAGHDYTVIAHATVEIASPGQVFDRHEYGIVDESGAVALLVEGDLGDPANWTLYLPQPVLGLTSPYEAAELRTGPMRRGADPLAEIVTLFRSTARSLEGRQVEVFWPREVEYGFLAKVSGGWVLSRWSEAQLEGYRGQRISSADMAAAFHVSLP